VDIVNTIQEHLDSIEEGLPFAIETYEAYKTERVLEVSRHASVNMHHLIQVVLFVTYPISPIVCTHL